MKVIQLYTNEKKLIEKAAQGDRKSQQRIYEKHVPRMLSVCRQYIKTTEIAEECMLNGFFKAFTKMNQYGHDGSFEGWLRKIMVRACLDHLRKKDLFKYADALDDQQHAAADENNGEDDDCLDLEILQSLVDALPQGYKNVFLMIVVDGFKHSEVAMALDISENTSKSQFRKARLLLQEQVKQIKKQSYEA